MDISNKNFNQFVQNDLNGYQVSLSLFSTQALFFYSWLKFFHYVILTSSFLVCIL